MRNCRICGPVRRRAPAVAATAGAAGEQAENGPSLDAPEPYGTSEGDATAPGAPAARIARDRLAGPGLLLEGSRRAVPGGGSPHRPAALSPNGR
jgi:hypothetical protein